MSEVSVILSWVPFTGLLGIGQFTEGNIVFGLLQLVLLYATVLKPGFFLLAFLLYLAGAIFLTRKFLKRLYGQTHRTSDRTTELETIPTKEFRKVPTKTRTTSKAR